MKDKIEKINESRIVKHISGRWLIQINDSEFEYLDEWINHYITQAIDTFVQKSEEKSYKHVHGNVESEDAFTTREDILQIADELKTEVSK